MGKLPILCGQERVGEVETELDRLYTCLRVRVPLRRGMWRAWAIGERGEIRIGTLEPVNGESVIARRFSRQSLSKVGTLTRVEVRPAEATDETSAPTEKTTARTKETPARVAAQTPAHPETNASPPCEAWKRAGTEPLFRTKRFRRQARHIREALTRTDGDRRRVALVRDENAPFPIPELFCFASAAKIGTKDYWVFAFDRREWPIL